MKRKICVVTGSRADCGVLCNTIREIDNSKGLELLLVITGAHLSPEFGYTVKEIEKDGFKISDRVDMGLSSNTPAGIGKSVGLGIIGLIDCFKRLAPDMLLILGDRYEIFAAATAAMLLNLPIAHMCGGDITEGAIDDQIRHAITKMSSIHFVSLPQHKRRLKQMGEESWRIHVIGEPCADNIRSLEKMSKRQIEDAINFKFSYPMALVTFHPVTLELNKLPDQIDGLLAALSTFQGKIIFTYPNSDAGGRLIINKINKFVEAHSNATVFKSLGYKLYLNLLAHVDLVVGNSSSGIIETPSFRLPTVNIGNRQKGRFMPKNVICVSENSSSIVRGIKKALSPQFKRQIAHMRNPYIRGNVAKKITRVFLGLELGPRLLQKKFIDL